MAIRNSWRGCSGMRASRATPPIGSSVTSGVSMPNARAVRKWPNSCASTEANSSRRNRNQRGGVARVVLSLGWQRADEPNPLVAVQHDVGDPAEPEFLTLAFDEPTHHGIAVEETHELALNLVEDPDLLQHILDIGPARCRVVHDRFGIEERLLQRLRARYVWRRRALADDDTDPDLA